MAVGTQQQTGLLAQAVPQAGKHPLQAMVPFLHLVMMCFSTANSGDCAVSAFTEINSLTTSGYTDTITITNIMRVVQTSTSTWAHSGGTIHCNRTNSFALYLEALKQAALL